MNDNPKGVCVVITDDKGHVGGEGTDFSMSKPGGFNLYEAQKRRARIAAINNMLNRYCSPVIADVIGEHGAERIVGELVSNKGWKVTDIPINQEKK